MVGASLEQRKRKLSAFVILPLIVLAGLCCYAFLENAGLVPRTVLYVYGAGAADSYGNRIELVLVTNNKTGAFWSCASVNYTAYTSGCNLTIDASVHTFVTVTVFLNHTFASSALDAASKTRCYMNITGVYTNAMMVLNYYSEYNATFWRIEFNYPDQDAGQYWVPSADITYGLSILYQAYY